MAEDTEPLEILSVGIEADIRDLLNGVREGVKESAEILSKMPAAEIEVDASSLAALGEEIARDINLLSGLNLSAAQMGRVVREGAEEGASALQRMAAQILEVLSIDAPPMLAEHYGMAEEQFQQAVEYLKSLGDAFKGSQSDIALFVQSIDAAEIALSRLEDEASERVISASYRLEQILHSLPSARIVEVAKQFASNIKLAFEEWEVNAKKIESVEGLGVPAGGVVRFQVEGEDAFAALEALQAEMVDLNLITKEATFSLEELAAGPLEPKLVEIVGTIEEVVAGFNQVQLTTDQLDQVVRERAEGVAGLAADLVEYAKSFGATLGEMANHLNRIGRAGIGPLQEVLERFRELASEALPLEKVFQIAEGIDKDLADVLRVIEEFGPRVEQAQIPLEQLFEMDEDAATLVDLAKELGVSFAEAGLRLYQMGEYGAEGLQEIGNLLMDFIVVNPEVAKLTLVLDKLNLTAEQTAQILSQRETGGLAETLARVVEEAEKAGDTLGHAALGMLWAQEMEPEGLEAVVQAFKEFTTEIPSAGVLGDYVGELEKIPAVAQETTQALSAALTEMSQHARDTVAIQDIFGQITTNLEELYEAEQVGAEASANEVEQLAGTVAREMSVLLGMGRDLEEVRSSAVSYYAQVAGINQQSVELAEKVADAIGRIPPVSQKAAQALEGTVSAFYNLTEQMLHARPAAVLSSEMRQLGEDVKVVFQGIEANAQSMLNLLTLGVPKGGIIEIQVEAADAIATLGAVETALVNAELIAEEAKRTVEELATLALPQEVLQPTDFALDPAEMAAKYKELGVQLYKLQLTGDQTTAVLVEGTEKTATAVQGLAASLLEVTLLFEKTLSQAGQQLVETGVADIADLKAVQDYLEGLPEDYKVSQQAAEEYWTALSRGIEDIHQSAEGAKHVIEELANTHINPSPLADSIESIIEALNRMNEALDKVPERIERIKHAPLEIDLTQVEQLVLPTPSGMIPTGRVEYFAKQARDLPMIFEPAEPIIAGLKERIVEMFQALKDGVMDGVSHLGDLVQRYLRVGEAADAASLGVLRCNELIAKGAEEGSSGIDRMIATIVRLSQASGESFKSIAKGMVDSGAISKTASKDLLSALRSATGGGLDLKGAFNALGPVVKAIFGSMIGMSAVQALRRLLKEMRAVAEEAIELQVAIVQLGVAVRAVQRQIGEAAGSIASWRSYVRELRGEFKNLSQVNLTQAVAQTVLLTREMGFNEEQMRRVMRAASALAAIHGIDVTQAVTRVVRALTGYGRGLYSLGVFMSRAQLNAEALAMGFNKTWTELTTQERAMVALNVIMRQTEPLVEDLDDVYGSWGGRIQVVEERTEDLKSQLGKMFAPVIVFLREDLLKLVEVLTDASTATLQLGITAAASVAYIQAFGAALWAGHDAATAMKLAAEVADAAMLHWGEMFAQIEISADDILEPLEELSDELEQDFAVLVELTLKYGDQFGDALDRWNEAVRDAGADLLDSLAELEADLSESLTDAFQDYLDEMDELGEEYQDRRGDILLDAQDELQEIEDDYNRRRAEAEAKLNRRLIRLQEDYQRDAHRLRERFIEDLRGAVAKRDVWAAIDLIKGFIRERRELKENYETNRDRMIKDHEWSMAELNREQEERRQQVEDDRARQLAELDEWLAERQAEIAADHAEEEQEIRDTNAEQEQDLRDSYEQRMKDLNENLESRLIAIAVAMAGEEELTASGAYAVFQALFKVFGFGGDIDMLMDAFEQRMAREIRIRVGIEQVWDELTGAVPGMQKGGTIIARKPTLVSFGEAGPEMATFIPLNQLSRIDHTQKNLGILDINVNADQYFSIDFEHRVEEAIAAFVGGVIQ